MNGYRFEVGDMVRCTRQISDSYKVFGREGIVVHINRSMNNRYDFDRVGVDWGAGVGAHNCEGHCPDGHGWYVDGSAIELIDEIPAVNFDCLSLI